jgi:hypothetical protein
MAAPIANLRKGLSEGNGRKKETDNESKNVLHVQRCEEKVGIKIGNK